MKHEVLIPNQILIEYADIEQRKNIELKEKEKASFKEAKDYYYYLSHEVNNKINLDGRINFGKTKDGLIVANTVSPYNKKFTNNIEPKIIDLVNLLNKKRYLTYSSCQGHCLYSRRFVGIAFPNEEEREIFISQFKNTFLPGVIFKKLNFVTNIDVSIDEKNYPIIKDRKDLSNMNVDIRKKNEAEYFNVVFHRNYEEYFFLELIILNELEIPFKFNIENIYTYILKRFFWDFITKKVTNKINKDLKKFKY